MGSLAPGSGKGPPAPVVFRLYRMRFAGTAALVTLNIVSALNTFCFTAIALSTATRFNVSFTLVNWLTTITFAAYLVSAPVTAFALERFSIRTVATAAAFLGVLGAWLHYAATAPMLSTVGAYTLLFLGSILAGAAQSVFQIIPPMYSEMWFNQKGRTTAIMVAAVANPLGAALVDVLAPGVVSGPADIATLLLILGIVTTATAPLVLLLGLPPTPPSLCAEERSNVPPGQLWSTLKTLVGRGERGHDKQALLDFWIVAFLFSVIVGFFDAYLTLIAQIFSPVGYDSTTSGYIGATTIVAGLLAAGVTAPLFDRVLRFRLALATKVLVPIIGLCFLAFVWVVRPGSNLGAIYFLSTLIGISAFSMLPVALELAPDVLWGIPGAPPAVTSAILYALANLASVVCVLGMNGLQGTALSSPPYDMHSALVFQGVTVFVATTSVVFLRGIQRRKLADSTGEVSIELGPQK